MTGKERHSLDDLVCKDGFGKGDNIPNDSACPLTKYRPDFIPSQLMKEALSGWYPTGLRHCLGCELCSPTPETSFPHCADTILLVDAKREGYFPRAFGGAMDAIIDIQIRNESPQNRLDWLTPELDVAKGSEKGEVALFVGNAPYYDVLLGDEIGYKATDEIRAAVQLLNSVGVKPVILADEVNTGGDRLHAGDGVAYIALGVRNRDLLRGRGVKTIVTTCDDIRYTLANRYPGRIPDWDFKVRRLADFLVERGGRLAFMPAPEVVAIQPPDRYSDPDGMNSVRRLLNNIPELIIKEIETGHPSTFGGWGQYDAVSHHLETDFLKAAEATGASTVLIPGTRMLIRFLDGRRPGSWEETSIRIKGFYGFLAGHHAVQEEFTGA